MFGLSEQTNSDIDQTAPSGQTNMGRNDYKGKELRNPGRDISFPIFTRKEIETKRIRKKIKTIISRLNDFLSFLSNI